MEYYKIPKEINLFPYAGLINEDGTCDDIDKLDDKIYDDFTNWVSNIKDDQNHDQYRLLPFFDMGIIKDQNINYDTLLLEVRGTYYNGGDYDEFGNPNYKRMGRFIKMENMNRDIKSGRDIRNYYRDRSKFMNIVKDRLIGGDLNHYLYCETHVDFMFNILPESLVDKIVNGEYSMVGHPHQLGITYNGRNSDDPCIFIRKVY